MPTAKTAKPEWLYPEFTTKYKWAGADGPITSKIAKALLGWESEEDYVVRKRSENPKLKAEDLLFGDEYLLKDVDGRKIVCWNNDKNRPFTASHAYGFAQTILTRYWAGPTTFPGETVNGESISISRTGRVKSGQHRLIALILAWQMWMNDKKKWGKLWPTEPVLESVVHLGTSDDPRITRTLDNVRTRTLSDTLVSNGYFEELASKEEYKKQERSLSGDQRQLCKMLDKAVCLLWERTGAGKTNGDKVYETHSEDHVFLEHHNRLVDCVKHLFEENKEHSVNKLKLSAGLCSALMYLMASSATDGDEYRAAKPRTEKHVNFDNFDKAKKFWTTLLQKTPPKSMLSIREALGNLVNKATGEQPSDLLKHCVICKAWRLYVDGEEFTAADLALRFVGEGAARKLDEEGLDFGGIDLGHAPASSLGGEELTPDEVRERQAQVDLERVSGNGNGRAPGEVKTEPTVFDADGKPPAPKPRPRARVETPAEPTPAATAEPTAAPKPRAPRPRTAAPAAEPATEATKPAKKPKARK